MSKLITVRKEGGASRVITITDIIPAEWQYITLEVLKKEKNNVRVNIKRVS